MNNPAEPRAVVFTSLLSKTYLAFESKVEVLKNINLEVKEGEFITISGPSGSGKTTLLNIIGAIDKQTSGKIYVFDEDLETKNEDFLAEFRCTRVGFVFQSYNLVSTLTVFENVAFPMEWRREPDLDIRKRVEELVELVGLQQRSEHFPFQLSGGEQQRVAFARALANDPPMLLVDEPTGNLDRKTSAHVVEILRAMRAQNKTVIVATHDSRISELADQKLWLENGTLMSQNE